MQLSRLLIAMALVAALGYVIPVMVSGERDKPAYTQVSSNPVVASAQAGEQLPPGGNLGRVPIPLQSPSPEVTGVDVSGGPGAAPSPEDRLRELLDADGMEGLSLAEQEDHFKWLRASATQEVLKEEARGFQGVIHAVANQDIVSRVEAGEYVVIQAEPDGTFPLLQDHNREQVALYRRIDSTTFAKIVLPEPKYPLLYRGQRRIVWLEDLVFDRHRLAMEPSGD